MIKLGKKLIAFANGKNYPLKRYAGGQYVDGLWVEGFLTPVNQTVPINWNDSPSTIIGKVNDVEGGEGITLDGNIIELEELKFNFAGDFEEHPLIVIVSSGISNDESNGVPLSIEKTTEADEDTHEIQTLSFNNPDVTPIVAGTFVLSIGAPIIVEIPTTCFASIQPLSGNDLRRFPQGDDNSFRLKAYSSTELRVLDKVTGAKADEITVDGQVFQVESVEKWPNYWKAFLILEKSPG